MQNLPQSPQQVKYISCFYNLENYRAAFFIETADELHTESYHTQHISLRELLYTPAEWHDSEANTHPAGFVYYDLGQGKIQVPLKPIEGITTLNGQDLDPHTFIIDPPENPQHYGLERIPPILRITREPQPGEIDDNTLAIWRTKQRARNRLQTHQPPPRPSESVHSGPPSPLPQQPTAAPQEPGPSDKLQLRLHRLPYGRLHWPLSHGLTLAQAVIWLLCRDFYLRRQSPDHGIYCDMGEKQIALRLTLAKPALKRTAPADIAPLVDRMGTSLRTVKRAMPVLEQHGFLRKVCNPKPGERTTKRRVADNEKDRRLNLGLTRKAHTRTD